MRLSVNTLLTDMFSLAPLLQQDTILLGEFPLSQIRIMNDARFPWVILIPKINGVEEIFHLSSSNRMQLIEESSFVADRLKFCTHADKINIATLGNIVSQLHVHHIARFINDDCWPAPVWGRGERILYTKEEGEQVAARLKTAFSQLLL